VIADGRRRWPRPPTWHPNPARPAVNNGATFYIPAHDHLYKAAYYKGGGTNAGY
jgi:hypothetical protein